MIQGNRATPPRAAGWMIPVLLMGAAALFRILLLGTVFTNVDSDQAIVGVMADHIRAGQHPLVYYGQPYQGSLEAAAAALLCALFGTNDWTLRLPVLLCAVLFVGAIYALGARLYGRRVAALSALVVAFGPGMLLYYGDVTGFGYGEVALLGTALLILQARYPDARRLPGAAALAMGLLAGCGVWTEPLMGEYLPALGVAYLLPLLSDHRVPRGWSAVARAGTGVAVGFLIGCAPLLLYNLRHHGATLSYLFPPGQPRDDHLALVQRQVTESLPILLGLAIPNPNHAVFAHMAARYPIRYAVGVGVGVYLLGRLLLGLPRRVAALARPPRMEEGAAAVVQDEPRDGALALVGVTCLLCFALTHSGTGDSAIDTARYLFPLYTLTPLALHLALPRRPRRAAPLLAALLIGGLLVAAVPLTLATPQTLAPRRPIGALIRVLEARGVRVVYLNYWLAYQLSFESHERVLGIPVDGLRLARVRVPGDLTVAARTPAGGLAWIFPAGSQGEQSFRQLLAWTRTRARRTPWANLAIYHHAARPLRPSGPYQFAGTGWFEDTPPVAVPVSRPLQGHHGPTGQTGPLASVSRPAPPRHRRA